MRIKMSLALAQSNLGRIVLHTICAARDHKLAWHWRGIVREINILATL